ncbi:MAG: adenine deaminase C-terminal domain-containing protein [Chloroflexota bacterium]
MQPSQAKELGAVALGKAPADFVLTGGDLVNVYTGEVIPGQDIAIKGDRIAFAGKSAGHTIGPGTRVINITGKTVIPGLTDFHNHLWNYFGDLADFADIAAASGTTSVLTEAAELFLSLGLPGFNELTRATRRFPVRFFFAAPSHPTLSPGFQKRALPARDAARLLRRQDVLTLGETFWPFILNGDQRLLGLFETAAKLRRGVGGHSAGATGNRLQAYIAAGVTDCHEPISPEEAIERARLGLYTLLRRGNVRDELPSMTGLLEAGIDLRRFCLVSDGVDPLYLTEHGYMDAAVQELIDLGFPPVTAIQMATLNPAVCFGLDRELGGIAPGRYADIAVIPDIRTIRPELVLCRGRIISENGRVTGPSPRYRFSQALRSTVRLPRPVSVEDFKVAAEGLAAVRVIRLETDLVTREETVHLTPVEGRLRADPASDLLKVAFIDRINEPGKTFTGFIKGCGLRRGAIATSTTWDLVGITVVGTDEADMAFAANRIRELQGGLVVCSGGRVLAELPLPVNGFLSDLPAGDTIARLRSIQKEAEGLGSRLPTVYITLMPLTSCSIPFIRICEAGYMDIKGHRVVGLPAD